MDEGNRLGHGVPGHVCGSRGLSQTAEFEVTALAAGHTTIRATAGTDIATAVVKVTGGAGDKKDPPAETAQIAFAPDHIKLRSEESREVVLLIKPPQKADVEVVFEVVSDVPDLFLVGDQRTLSNGAASLKVMIQAGSEPGAGSLFVTLPESLGGGKAELVVEVAVKNNGSAKK